MRRPIGGNESGLVVRRKEKRGCPIVRALHGHCHALADKHAVNLERRTLRLAVIGGLAGSGAGVMKIVCVDRHLEAVVPQKTRSLVAGGIVVGRRRVVVFIQETALGGARRRVKADVGVGQINAHRIDHLQVRHATARGGVGSDGVVHPLENRGPGAQNRSRRSRKRAVEQQAQQKSALGKGLAGGLAGTTGLWSPRGNANWGWTWYS